MIGMLDHTADVGFELEAPTLEALFDEARQALLMTLFEEPPKGGEGERLVRLSGPDRETLLVRWINELVFFVQEESFADVWKPAAHIRHWSASRGTTSPPGDCTSRSASAYARPSTHTQRVHKSVVCGQGEGFDPVLFVDGPFDVLSGKATAVLCIPFLLHCYSCESRCSAMQLRCFGIHGKR
jgi:hypothetical protein